MKKVYCKNCKHLLHGHKCGADKEVVDTWYNQRNEYGDPKEKNRNNNCKDYKPK